MALDADASSTYGTETSREGESREGSCVLVSAETETQNAGQEISPDLISEEESEKDKEAKQRKGQRSATENLDSADKPVSLESASGEEIIAPSPNSTSVVSQRFKQRFQRTKSREAASDEASDGSDVSSISKQARQSENPRSVPKGGRAVMQNGENRRGRGKSSDRDSPVRRSPRSRSGSASDSGGSCSERSVVSLLKRVQTKQLRQSAVSGPARQAQTGDEQESDKGSVASGSAGSGSRRKVRNGQTKKAKPRSSATEKAADLEPSPEAADSDLEIVAVIRPDESDSDEEFFDALEEPATSEPEAENAIKMLGKRGGRSQKPGDAFEKQLSTTTGAVGKRKRNTNDDERNAPVGASAGVGSKFGRVKASRRGVQKDLDSSGGVLSGSENSGQTSSGSAVTEGEKRSENEGALRRTKRTLKDSPLFRAIKSPDGEFMVLGRKRKTASSVEQATPESSSESPLLTHLSKRLNKRRRIESSDDDESIVEQTPGSARRKKTSVGKENQKSDKKPKADTKASIHKENDTPKDSEVSSPEQSPAPPRYGTRSAERSPKSSPRKKFSELSVLMKHTPKGHFGRWKRPGQLLYKMPMTSLSDCARPKVRPASGKSKMKVSRRK